MLLLSPAPAPPCVDSVWTVLLSMLCLVTQLCLTLCDPMDCSLPGSSVHGDSPAKNTGVGCQDLLQGIFQTVRFSRARLLETPLA